MSYCVRQFLIIVSNQRGVFEKKKISERLTEHAVYQESLDSIPLSSVIT